MAKELDYFQLMRNFWDWSFENPDIVKPTHCALFGFIVEHCNRMGWKDKFGLPASMVLDAIGIKSYSVYKKTFDDLVDFGFIEVIQYSKNQHSSNVIALKENYKAHYKALDKANIKHVTKQVSTHSQSTLESTVSIIKQDTITHKTKKHITNIQTLMSEATASDVSEGNQEYFEIAKSFYELFKHNSTETIKVEWLHLKKIKAEKMCNDFRLMIQTDKRTMDDLRLIWKFLKTDSFWMQNIQSSEKLREKMDQLLTKAKNGNTINGNRKNGKGYSTVATPEKIIDWLNTPIGGHQTNMG